MHVYVIAECGQNHNGQIDLGRELIDMAAMPIYHDGERFPGVDAVKFTVRDLDAECTPAQWRAPYDSPHAYGPTYGEHRDALELTHKEIGVLCNYAHALGLDFVLTICNPGALSVLQYAKADRIKIASRDLGNVPLLRLVSKAGLPVILSTGMYEAARLVEAIDILHGAPDIWVLHCLSEYPARYAHIGLADIAVLRESTNRRVGYSDHTTGTQAAPWAVIAGATIVEKHITLDHGMRGTDHAGSMDHEGLRRMVRDIRNAERSMGLRSDPPEETVYKLGRSACYLRDMDEGEVAATSDLHMLSPGDGLEWWEAAVLLLGGRALSRDVARNTQLHREDVG